MAGGPVFWLLAAMGAAAAVLFLARLLALRRAHVDHVDFIRGVGNLMSGGRMDEALALCEETPAPVARIAAAALRQGPASAKSVRDAIDSAGRLEAGRISRRFAAIAVIAQTAPLLGLLGAFIGGIRTVCALGRTEIVVQADLLSGMMETLVPAAAGLLVGIAAQIMFAILRVRFERLVLEMEAAADETIALMAPAEAGGK